MNKQVGFIGLGQMGKWMALNVVKAGFQMTVYDLDPRALSVLTEAGAGSAESPSRIGSNADWVFLSLPNTAVVEAVVFGENGLAEDPKPGLVIVDCGTTGYLPTLGFEKRLREKGVVFVDAPVSGMEARARDGQLTVMVGGDEAVFDDLRPALEAMGDRVLHLGPVGSGQLTKLVNQLLFDISCAAIAEILPMAAKLGLDPEKVTEVITSGTGRSFAAEFFAPLALEGIFDRGYPLEAAYKDIVSAFEISADRKIPLPLTHATATTYQMALAAGYGREGKGAMIKVFEELVGAKFRKAGGQ